MDGDPDVKRPRLDRDHAAYPPTASRPPTTPAPPHGEPHPASAGPAGPPHPFPPGQLPPGQPQHHPPAQPGGPQYRETLPDPRSLPQYQQSPGVHPGPPDPRAGYGPLNAQQSRPFPPEKEGSRRASVSAHPQVTEAHRGPAPPPAAQESHPGHMEHGGHHPAYLPQPMDPYINGGAPNGLPYHPSQEPYPGAQVGPPPPHSYPPTPVGAYQPGAYAQGPSSYGITKRKQVRAQQACNNCRQRKQKCDEARPCGYCKQEQLECEYKEVPPPKTDRTMAMLMDQQKRVEERVESLFTQVFQSIDRLSKQISGHDTTAIPVSTVAGTLQGEIDSSRLSESELQHHVVPSPQTYDEVAAVRPEEHHTGAHHLMNKWIAIKDFFRAANVGNEEYVHDEEERRSLLDPYDWSLQPFEGEMIHDLSMGRSPSSTGYQSEFAAGGSPTQYGGWTAKYPAHQASGIKPEFSNLGGLRPDGKLALDEFTVRRLHDSYLKHMWIIHPFIDARELKRMVDKFVVMYSTTSISPWTYPTTPEHQEAYSGIGIKRKRHNMSGDDHSTPSSPGGSLQGIPKKDSPRVIETAIVLLVLALGKILDQANFLLDDGSTTRSRSTPNAMFAVSQQTPSQAFIKPSPPSSTAYGPMTAGSSPSFERPSSGAESRGSPGFIGGERRDRERRPQYRNLDVIPGLAYFAPASLILGNQHAGNEIPHAQAYLLAGLYLGQLGRVLDSWNYIYTASRSVVVLLRTKHYNSLKEVVDTEREHHPPQLDDISTTVSTLYWSTLQLESDIRAELDKLPPSLIWGYEDSLLRPGRLLGVSGPEGYEYLELHSEQLSVRDVMYHYLAQIHIRKTLNRAHAALYSVEDRSTKARRGTYRVSWADASAPQLWEQLQEWRKRLPIHLRWVEEDDPATDINNARLRGKYYGAAYMITRPYLHAALYQIKTDDLQAVDWEKAAQGSPGIAPHTKTSEITTLPSSYTDQQKIDHIIWACKQCIDSAIKSTTAFDGVSPTTEAGARRPRVTNIHGTAAAQFSNILVLAAAYKNPYLRSLVPEDKFFSLMTRTIALLARLSPLSPVFATNQRVLEVTRTKILEARHGGPEEIHSYHGTPITETGRGGSASSSLSGPFSGR